MKKYLVIGNPIEHSMSPQIHNYWIKKNNLSATYEKEKLTAEGLKNLIFKIREKEIHGINVTVPFKKEIISYTDNLTPEAEKTKSVNTIFLNKNKIIGHNTDIEGFERSIYDCQFDITNKEILILGAGGVVPSIVLALNKMKASKIMISNRTKDKAEELKDLFEKLTILNWGDIPNFDMIINATSVGLKNSDEIGLDFSKINKNKFFYDVIYNPNETNFLKNAKKHGNKTENGKKMFIYQAAASFKIWHGIEPQINNDIINVLS